MKLARSILTAVMAWLMVSGGLAQASPPEVFGDYTVYHNAFNTNTLQPEIAEVYNIVRSKNRGMLTISVNKKSIAPAGKPVHAKILISASNLTGQLRQLDVREVDEGDFVYYLSEFHVAHEEVLDFNLLITPEGESFAHPVKFRQKFYTD